MNKADILVFAAHPDDAEIGVGGILAKHAKAGKVIVICDLSYAELSSNGTVELRQQEAKKASEILGINERINLELPDRGLFVDGPTVEKIARVIRKYRPEVVLAPYWEDRHPDHVMCSRLVEEAVFSAKLRNLYTDVESWQVQQLYFYFINDTAIADLMIDITEVYDTKREALRAYQSQFMAASDRDSVETPLTQGYLEQVEARDRMLAQKWSLPYAEGLVCKLPLLADSLDLFGKR